jgi:hypothetical protein
MNTKISKTVFGVLCAAFLSGCVTNHAPVTYEYHMYRCANTAQNGDPNIGQLGADGWQLVGIVADPTQGGTDYWFKRIKR